MKNLFLFLIIFSAALATNAQDSLVAQHPLLSNSGVKHASADSLPKYNPRKAIIRSAIIPGWGQITNHKVWKVPIVYAALGVTTYLFVRNLHQYRDAKQAYILATDNDPSNDNQIKQPYFNVKDQPERIRTFRNGVRQNMDYCGIFFLAFWGLNVADAAVDAHLKTFDVSNDLSLQIKPGYSPMANTSGISLVLNIGK